MTREEFKERYGMNLDLDGWGQSVTEHYELILKEPFYQDWLQRNPSPELSAIEIHIAASPAWTEEDIEAWYAMGRDVEPQGEVAGAGAGSPTPTPAQALPHPEGGACVAWDISGVLGGV